VKATTTPRSAAIRAACFETLEDRRHFNVSINGTSGPDVIWVAQNGLSIDVTVNGVTTRSGSRPVWNVTINGLGGNDQIGVSEMITIPVFINGGDGNDNLKGGKGNDVIDGGNGNDMIRGSSGDDILRGMSGDDTLLGYLGNDQLYGGFGNDKCDGEFGNDYVSGNGQGVEPYADNDTLRGGDGNDYIEGFRGFDVLYGDGDDDTLLGGIGNDRIYGGGGTNHLIGNEGNDILVSIGGSTSDKLWGNSGIDSFWMDDARTTEYNMDADAAESAGSNFHFVSQFENNVTYYNGQLLQERPTKVLVGQNLRDPIAAAPYVDYRSRPLFGGQGPRVDDVRQGDVGDCYFVAGLSAIAKTNPNRIREAVVDLGDGTYAVRFHRNGVAMYYRVDGDLPAVNGQLKYAKLGNGNSLWVAIVEKAFAYHRYRDGGKYENLELGLSTEPFAALANPHANFWGADAAQTLALVKQQLDMGRTVVASTKNENPLNLPFVAKHQYVVMSVDTVNKTVTVRNPYGFDGAGNDANPNDGYYTFNAGQFFSFFRNATWAKA